MSLTYSENRTFKCEKLSVFTCRDTETVQATELRKYIKQHWRKIFQGLKNSTILIIGGVHGSPMGKVEDREDNIEGIKNQVGSERDLKGFKCMTVRFSRLIETFRDFQTSKTS